MLFLFLFKDHLHWITIDFNKLVTVTGIKIQFQGGYGCKKIQVQFIDNHQTVNETSYPQDSNILQQFNYNDHQAKSLKLIFTENSDMFGRLIIYHLDVFGS